MAVVAPATLCATASLSSIVRSSGGSPPSCVTLTPTLQPPHLRFRCTRSVMLLLLPLHVPLLLRPRPMPLRACTVVLLQLLPLQRPRQLVTTAMMMKTWPPLPS